MLLKAVFITAINVPEDVAQAIDERASIGALGDMQTYMQFKAARALGDAARLGANGEGASFAGMGVGLGAGMGLGATMAGVIGQTLQGAGRFGRRLRPAGRPASGGGAGLSAPHPGRRLGRGGRRGAGGVPDRQVLDADRRREQLQAERAGLDLDTLADAFEQLQVQHDTQKDALDVLTEQVETRRQASADVQERQRTAQAELAELRKQAQAARGPRTRAASEVAG